MDVSSVGSLSSALSQASVRETAGVLVQKKIMEIATQNAEQLLQALPQPSGNPPHLGQTIDVQA